ncbi:hypothetical protein EUX98_g2411 [Antrodiella citrinella]|uniref:Glutaredoxin domain-containing protein n=1 Tax=Antrodiella citrinella TaxID=2447956 RepID=A0A4S4N0H3_9APHY|nr:hypothetical protein EUX98_g2411 [Antrodiella citrinella]
MKSSPRPASPFRRRRIIWSVLLLTVVFFIYLFTRSPDAGWSLPIINPLKALSLGGGGAAVSHSNSRVSKVSDALAAERRAKVQEIHGLLHFVTAHGERRFNEEGGDTINVVGAGSVKVDPTQKVDYKVYSPDGEDDWQKHMTVLRTEHPLVVFSKSYCPYSRRAKALLESYDLSPAPTVIELDTRSDGSVIQAILGRLTGRSTVPNVILLSSSLGGSDDLALLDQENKLKEILEGGGVEVQAAKE